MSSTKTASASRASQPPPAKPPCNIHPTAIIADKAQITGTYPVEIGEDTVIHPHAKIRADHGSVTIGRRCMVYEKAVVGSEKTEGVPSRNIVIADYVNIDSAATVQAKSIGEGSEIGVKAVVGADAVLGRYCKVCPLEQVEAGEELGDFTVVHGVGQRRIDKTVKEHDEVRKARVEAQDKAVEVMKKLIPNAAAKWMG